MNPFDNLMATPTRLPEDPAVTRLAGGEDPLAVAAAASGVLGRLGHAR